MVNNAWQLLLVIAILILSMNVVLKNINRQIGSAVSLFKSHVLLINLLYYKKIEDYLH